jgi:Zn finger protein HypA/HybF involved in hydrogenase expression
MARKISHEDFIRRMEIDRPDIIVLGDYINSKTPIKCKCKKCGYTWYPYPNNILYNHHCPVCSNKIIVKGINDLWTTNSDIAKLLANPEDGYKYSFGSEEKLNWICPQCKSIIYNKSLNMVVHDGLSCPHCSDGISYPEKFMYNVLNQLNVDFIFQYSYKNAKWCKGINYNIRYDFYIQSFNCIIETHGLQHYEERDTSSIYCNTLQKEQENDEFKKALAIKNGIKEENYIVIDCRKSEMEWIRDHLLDSRLAELYDLTNINWVKINEESQKSVLFNVCDFYNKSYPINYLIEHFNLSSTTIRTYLKMGTKLGLCNYNAKEQQIQSGKQAGLHSKINNSKKVICLTTGEIFDSEASAAKKYNTYCSSIKKCCIGKLNYSGKSPVSNKKLQWKFIY